MITMTSAKHRQCNKEDTVKTNRYMMMAAAFVAVSCMVLVMAATAAEPLRPSVDTPLDRAKEEIISTMIGLPADEVYDRLKGMDFFLSEEFSARAVYRVFVNRRAEILARALDSLKSPMLEILDGRLVSRSADIGVARKIFEVFPDESVPAILELYRNGDAITKGNILRVSGRIAGGDRIVALLRDALDDRTACEQDNPEIGGDPLRLCDMAYNQLVLRYQMTKVLRAIGPVYRTEVRDYHIAIMKDLLGSGEMRK